jgi:hypothetical protein
VYFFVCSEVSYCSLEFCLSDRSRESVQAESHPHFSGSLLLHPDICLTGWIVSDEDNSEHRPSSLREEDLVPDMVEDGGGDETPIEYSSHETDYREMSQKAKKKPNRSWDLFTIPLNILLSTCKTGD